MGKGSGKGGGGGAGGGGRAVGGAPQPEEPPVNWGADTNYAKDHTEDPDAKPGGVVKGPGYDAQLLFQKDQDSIVAYTGGKVDGGQRFKDLNAEKLNEALYNPKKFLEEEGPQMMTRAKAFAKELDTSLGKVRNYEGETYRVIMDRGGEVAAKFTPGKNYVADHFVSTSRSTTPSYRAFTQASDNQTRFIIHGKRGKMIENVSKYMEEKEVVYRLKTKFHVESKKFNYARSTWDIVLREI